MNKHLLPYDPCVYRIVVLVLGLVVLASLLGTIILTIQDHSTPELLIALGSGNGWPGWAPSSLAHEQIIVRAQSVVTIGIHKTRRHYA